MFKSFEIFNSDDPFGTHVSLSVIKFVNWLRFYFLTEKYGMQVIAFGGVFLYKNLMVS